MKSNKYLKKNLCPKQVDSLIMFSFITLIAIWIGFDYGSFPLTHPLSLSWIEQMKAFWLVTAGIINAFFLFILCFGRILDLIERVRI